MSFYANGRYWAVYIQDTGSKFCYRSSTDTITWDAEVTIRSSVTEDSDFWSATYDGTYIHYVIRPEAAPNDAFYRRGLPNEDGTITWSAAEQTVIASNTQYHTIAVDTDGYAYIACAIGGDQVTIYKNANNDGTWATAAGWPKILTAGGGPPTILALTNGRMACLYGQSSNTLRIKRWDGAAWGSERAVASSIENRFYYSTVAEDDDVHLVFIEDVSYDLIYVRYDYSTNSFGDEVTLYSGATATSTPVITRATDTNDLYVFWENDPTNDHIFYIKYNYYTGAWDTYVDLVDESVIDGLPANGYNLNTDYTSVSDKVGVYYIADPRKLKYKDVAEKGIVTTLPPSAVTSTSATLRGDITSVGTGAITTRGVQYNTSPSPTGAGYTEESGSFGTGVYSLAVTDLWADELFYCRAYVINSEGTSYGEWVSFLTTQGDQTSAWNPVGNETLVPVPSEPGTWFNPSPDTGPISSTWLGSILNPFLEASGFPVEFLWWVIFILLLEIVGIAAYGVGKHTLVVFIAGSFILGYVCAVQLIDWWLIFVYVSVGIPYLILESRRY